MPAKVGVKEDNKKHKLFSSRDWFSIYLCCVCGLCILTAGIGASFYTDPVQVAMLRVDKAILLWVVNVYGCPKILWYGTAIAHVDAADWNSLSMSNFLES